jgi:hypothetical protein
LQAGFVPVRSSEREMLHGRYCIPVNSNELNDARHRWINLIVHSHSWAYGSSSVISNSVNKIGYLNVGFDYRLPVALALLIE